MEAEGEAEAQWGFMFIEGFLRGRWWGACDTKLPGSIFSAEAGRALQRQHGGNVGIEIWDVRVGVTVRRDAVHHFWRSGNRTEGFPKGNSARTAQHRCRNGGPCPSIGYHQGARGYLSYKENGLDVSLTTPPYRWKELTLPWPNWMVDASLEVEAWRIELTGQAGGLQEPALDASLYRHLLQNVWVGAHAGRLAAPGWREPLERVAVSLRIE